MVVFGGIAAVVMWGALAQAELSGDDVRGVGVEQQPSYQLDSTLSGSWYSIASEAGVPGVSGNQEALTMNLIAFGAPLRDDGSPYSLQPFLQRESTLSVSFSGGRFDTGAQIDGVDLTGWNTGVTAGFDKYVRRWFAVFAGASYQYFHTHDFDQAQGMHSFSGNVGVGLRYRDTRVDLAVAEEGVRASGMFGSWRGSLTVAAATVIHRRLSLNASGRLGNGGEEGSFDAELFPAKYAGVFAGGFAGRYQPYSDPTLATRYIANAGFAGWFDATTALVGSYALTYEKDQSPYPVSESLRQLSHTLQVELYVRFQ